MENPYHAKIIIRAYELWEQAGCPEDKDDELYLQAEQELRSEDESNPPTPEAL